MTPETLQRLNRILCDRTASIPYGEYSGQSMFQWKRSGELLALERIGTKEIEHWSVDHTQCYREQVPICEWRLQRPLYPVEQWCLARWTEPECSEDEWIEKFGKINAYPKDGYWFSVYPIDLGIDPTEEISARCADQILWQMELGYHKTLKLMRERREAKDQKQDQHIKDMIEDAIGYHVPGARGGSYSVPLTKQG